MGYSRGTGGAWGRSWSALALAAAAGAAALLGPAEGAGADVTLVKDGQAQATIYVDQPWRLDPALDAAALKKLTPEQKAERERIRRAGIPVEDLVEHIRLITGATLPVVQVERPDQVKGPGIVLGELAVKLGAEAKFDTVVDESIRIVCKGDLVLIGGEGETGYRHGVYELLRKLGCDWIMPGEEGVITPTARTLVVPTMDVAKKPAFEVRSPWYSGGTSIVNAGDVERFERWKIRQQQTHGSKNHPDFLMGGHMWASLLQNYKTELAEKPELLAQVRKPDGTLGPGRTQLEPLHPRVLEMSLELVRGVFARYKLPKETHISISVGPNDGGGYSESPEALAGGAGRFDPLTGDKDQTDVLMRYVNALQAEAEKEFPNVRLGFLLYSVHSDYPMLVKPNPKFVGQFADITQSRFHSLLDDRSPTRFYYRRVLKLWGDLAKEQGNALWYYGYNWNLAENLLPYSKMKIWGQDLPYYHAMGIRGHNNEQDKAWSILGPHNYLMARQGWDIDLDWRKVLDDYCAKAFGKGGPFMAKYYLALIEAQETAGSEAGAYGALHLVFTPEFVAKAEGLLKQAAQAAQTPAEQKRVDYFSQPLAAAKIYLAFRQALMACDFERASKEFGNMVAQWEATDAKNPDLVSRYGRRYINWLFKPVAERGLLYSTGAYRIVHKIPDELPMVLDPHNAGAELGLHLPGVPHERWMKYRTFSSSFAEQGLLFYAGGVWYRHTFEGPAAADLAEGKGVGLFVGSVEDEVRVYLNGNYIGRGRGFIAPFTFDLSQHIKPPGGGKNVLAMHVIRNNYLNEMGRGGILYPCFVFAGPKLEKAAPNAEPLFRVLPGGSVEPLSK